MRLIISVPLPGLCVEADTRQGSCLVTVAMDATRCQGLRCNGFELACWISGWKRQRGKGGGVGGGLLWKHKVEAETGIACALKRTRWRRRQWGWGWGGYFWKPTPAVMRSTNCRWEVCGGCYRHQAMDEQHHYLPWKWHPQCQACPNIGWRSVGAPVNVGSH